MSSRVHLVTIEVAPSHPLMQLALVIPWQALAEMVLPDLKRTTAKGHWWRDRKLKLRLHIGALLLQWLYDLTDRPNKRPFWLWSAIIASPYRERVTGDEQRELRRRERRIRQTHFFAPGRRWVHPWSRRARRGPRAADRC